MTEEQAKPEDRSPVRPAYLSSVVALALGIVLAIGVSTLFALLGWGGELASQTAGAASGAAPLIIDGIRQRREQRTRPSLRAMTRGLLNRPKLYVASAFGFAVLILDSTASLLMIRLARQVTLLANGNPALWPQVFGLLGSVIALPMVLVGTYLFAVAAGHRLGERRRRWLLLGMGIYSVVRIATVLASGSSSEELGIGPGVIVVGIVVTLPLLTGIAMLGARRARNTQASYYARAYFRRLPPADQEAALALLDEAVPRRS
jgi:hypothetical protein